jgi:hypothetical protein
MTTNTIKGLAKLIRKGDRVALPGNNIVDPYDIEVYTVEDAWSNFGESEWVYLNVGLDAPIRLHSELSVTKVLGQQNSAGTTMVRIEDHDLKTLRTMLSGKGGTQPYLLRVDQRGDSVAFKVNEGTWTHGMGTAQAPY